MIPKEQKSLTASSNQKWSRFRFKYFEPEPGSGSFAEILGHYHIRYIFSISSLAYRFMLIILELKCRICWPCLIIRKLFNLAWRNMPCVNIIHRIPDTRNPWPLLFWLSLITFMSKNNLSKYFWSSLTIFEANWGERVPH